MMWQLAILPVEIPRGAHRVPVPHSVPQSGAPVPGREVSIMAGCENQHGLHLSETEIYWSPTPSSCGAHEQTCSVTD